MEKIKIAVLYTCHNRIDKTCIAVKSLINSINYYNNHSNTIVSFKVFLTDDGCSDGTAEAVSKLLPPDLLSIIQSDGNAFWAGGMRIAWNNAICNNSNYDFYLLLNDDTVLQHNCIEELLKTNDYSISKYKKAGVYTGFVCSPTNPNHITYGAKTYDKGIWGRARDIYPNGKVQECKMPNANILLVSKSVFDKIGILSDLYIHGAADWDYGLRASNAGFPVLTTTCTCGICEFDHDTAEKEAKKVINLSITDRKSFLDKPTKQYRDSLTFFKKYNKTKYAIVYIAYYINLFFPYLFYKLLKLRGH